MTRFARLLVVASAMLVVAAPAARAQVVASRDTTFETALLDIVLAPVRSGVVPALRVGNRALVPVVATLAVLDVATTTHDDGVVTFVRPTDGVAIQIDEHAHSVRAGSETRVADAMSLLMRNTQVLLDVTELARLLCVSMTVDWNELRVRVTNADSLPPIRRMLRASRYAQLFAPAAAIAPPDQYRPLVRPALDGAMIDYLISVPTQQPRQDAAFSASVGASVLGGSLETFVGGNVNGGSREVTASWLGVWRPNPWLTQLRIGDGLTSGPRARGVRGVTIGNAPFLRPLEYGTLPMRVTGDSAWEVESYLNGQLVRVDTMRGHDATVPLMARYGSNVIDRIAYGPLGEVRRSQQLLSLTASEILPAGTVEYGVSAGACRFGTCEHTANADLRFGLAPRLSARVGLEGESDSTRRVIGAPYAGAAVLAPGGVTVAGSVLARGEAVGTVRWEPALDHGAVIERVHQMQDVSFSDVIRGRASDRTSASAFTRLPWNDRAMQIAATWQDDRAAALTRQNARLSLGLRTPFGQLYPYGELQRLRTVSVAGDADATTRALGLSLYSLPSGHLGPVLRGTWLFATTEWRDDGKRFISATAARPVGSQLRIDATVTAGVGASPVFGVRFYGDLGVARVISSSTVAANTATTGSHQLQGSAYLDPHRRRVVLSRGPLLERGGVGGRVFLDMNANGRLDDDELPLAGAVVRVGIVSAVTDSAGWYLTTDILPFEPVLVQLESSSLDSPLWVGAFERLMLEPAPNSARRLDIPVLPGGVVEGTLTSGETPLAGVEVKLEAVDSDRRFSVTSFSDGLFTFLGIAPGRYRLRVESPAWAGQLPDIVEVRAVANGDRVRGLRLQAGRR